MSTVDAIATETRIFENEIFGRLRMLLRGEELWFVGADVCKALDIVNAPQAMNELDDDEKMLITSTICNTYSASALHIPPAGLTAVSESGLYSLIMRSRKPEAKAFKRWVTHEVLPSIRKTGEYVIEQPKTKEHEKGVDSTQLLIHIFEAAGIEGNQMALALDKIFVRENGYSALQTAEIQLVAPQQCQLYTPSELGRQLEPPLSPIKVNKMLATMGWQIKVEKKWEAVGDGVKYAVYLDTGKVHSNGTPVRQLKWTTDVLFALQGQLNSEE